jgi:hypothetical protein
MGGQGERARQVVDPGGAAVLSLQENQPGLPRACAALFEGLRGPHPIDEGVVLGCDAQVEGGHGRRETRKGWRTEALAGVEALAGFDDRSEGGIHPGALGPNTEGTTLFPPRAPRHHGW